MGDAVHRGQGAAVPEGLLDAPLSTHALERARERLARRHLGTLGGGNHFVELDREVGGDGLWVLIHSGSRGLGAAVAGHHLGVARAIGEGSIPGIAVDSQEGRACLADLAWAFRFGAANRAALLHSAAGVVAEALAISLEEGSGIDVQHNFVAAEEHFGHPLWVHRKGAIAAPAGARVLIPGSMGTASYLAEGLGEPTAFHSASHGAGRVMARRQARERIRLDRFVRSMGRVVYDTRRASELIEEAPAAYRKIAEVLEDESDLVRPLLRLEPLVVLKG